MNTRTIRLLNYVLKDTTVNKAAVRQQGPPSAHLVITALKGQSLQFSPDVDVFILYFNRGLNCGFQLESILANLERLSPKPAHLDTFQELMIRSGVGCAPRDIPVPKKGPSLPKPALWCVMRWAVQSNQSLDLLLLQGRYREDSVNERSQPCM